MNTIEKSDYYPFKEEEDAFPRNELDSLLARNIELERSNTALEAFSYLAAHELNAPLRTVSLFAGLLKEKMEAKLDEEELAFFCAIFKSLERMHRLIDDMLNCARIKPKENDVPVFTNTEEALREALHNLHASIQGCDAKISYQTLPQVKACPIQVTQLFQNLISNALKFRSEETPLIIITATREGDFYQFSITDNGIGFDLKYARQIFEMFKRLHNQEKYPGSGLGLSICKKIVNRHGGEIWAEPNPRGGSIFKFTLPAAVPLALHTQLS